MDLPSERFKCGTCATVLTSTLRPFDTTGGEALDGEPVNEFVIVWSCPNFENHGTFVPCPHCGQNVPSSGYHYTSRPGLIGSGRYTCQRLVAVSVDFEKLFARADTGPAPCSEHAPKQHRDHKRPWCPLCGCDEFGELIGVSSVGFAYAPPDASDADRVAFDQALATLRRLSEKHGWSVTP